MNWHTATYELHHRFLKRALAKERHQCKLHGLRNLGRSVVIDREHRNGGQAPITDHRLSWKDGDTAEFDIDGRNHAGFEIMRIRQGMITGFEDLRLTLDREPVGTNCDSWCNCTTGQPGECEWRLSRQY